MNHRSRLAIRWSIEALAASTGAVYFWTFTFRENLTEVEARAVWSDYLHRWRESLRRAGKPAGLGRYVWVWERGEKRGRLHVHLVTDVRHDVRVLRDLRSGGGIGRVHVAYVPSRDGQQLGGYLGKYCGKGGGAVSGRSWAVGGVWGPARTRVREIEVSSGAIGAARAAYRDTAEHGLRFDQRAAIARRYVWEWVAGYGERPF